MAEKRDIAPFLQQTAFFKGLSQGDIESCAAAMAISRLDAKEMLFARGEPGDHLYIVMSGEVRLSVVSEDGRELSVRIVAPGEMLGELSALDGAPRSADAIALKPTVVLSLSRRATMRLMETIPAFLQRIVMLLCSRLRATTDQLEAIALHTVEERLARLLLADLGSVGGDPSRARVVTLTQGELAQLIGATRPKVNAALAAIEGEGGFRKKQGKYEVKISVLRRLARLPDE